MRVVGKTKVDDRPIPTANFHAIRHTFATRLLEAGVHPKVVAELLGHSDVSVVLNTYSHVLPELKEQAIAAMDKHLRRSGKKEKPKVIRWVRRWPEKEKAPEGGPEDWLQ
jgi:integrase